MERLNRSRRDKEDIPRIQRRTLQKKKKGGGLDVNYHMV